MYDIICEIAQQNFYFKYLIQLLLYLINIQISIIRCLTFYRLFLLSIKMMQDEKKKIIYYQPPESLKHLLWSLLISLLILFFMGQTVFNTCFIDARQQISPHLRGWWGGLFFFFFCDILVSFQRGIYVNGILYLRKDQIINHYMSGKFYLDIIILILLLLSVILTWEYAFLFRFAIYIKLYDLYVFDEIIFRKIHTHRTTKQFYMFVRVILIMLMISHWMGCFFFLIDYTTLRDGVYGTASTYPTHYWRLNSYTYSSVATLSISGQYLYSLYWAVATITTVAYGDITAKNPQEALYVIFILLFSTISISLILEFILNVLLENYNGMTKFLRQLSILKTYMRSKSIPRDLQFKVRSYLQFRWYEQNYQDTIVEKEIRAKLPRQLENQMFLNSNYKIFSRVKLLTEIPNLILFNLFKNTTETKYYSSEIIFNPYPIGMLVEFGLIFVDQGKINRFYQYDQNTTRRISSRSQYDLKLQCVAEFISGRIFKMGLQCNNYCIIYKLDRNQFIEACKADGPSYQIICDARDEIIYSKNFEIINVQCEGCRSMDHTTVDCPECHYNTLQRGIIRQQENTRKKILRNKLKIKKWLRKPCLQLYFSDPVVSQLYHMRKYWQDKERQIYIMKMQMQKGQQLRIIKDHIAFEEEGYNFESYKNAYNFASYISQSSEE